MHIDSDGQFRAKHGAAAYEAWTPFVDAFKSVTLLARVDFSEILDDGPYVEGPGVKVQPLPYYRGGWELPAGLRRIRKDLSRIGDSSDIFIGRVPEFVSLEILRRAREVGARSLVMLVAEPSVIRYSLPGWAGASAESIMRSFTRKALAGATAVAYVSQAVFQERYPPPPGVPVIGRSNVRLPLGWLTHTPRVSVDQSCLRLISVGSLAGSIKGMDFLLKVVTALRLQGKPVSLTIVGSGDSEQELRAYALSKSIDVEFVGQVHSRDKMKALLDSAQVYVSGSRAEGLPRATVEAMARGLPVVTTAAGAASELVEPMFVVPVGDESAFAVALLALSEDAREYERQSVLSLIKAKEIAETADPARFSSFLCESFERFESGQEHTHG